MAEEKSKTRFGFLGYAILFLVGLMSFSFGGGTAATVISAICFVMAVMMAMVISSQLSRSEKFSTLANSIPLFVFIIFVSFNRFWITGFGGIFTSLLMLFGLAGAYLLGLCIKKFKPINVKIVVMTVLGFAALYVLINTIVDVASYGFFYVSRYQSMVYYYDGLHFLVGEEAKMIYGFSIIKASLPYASTLGFMLASTLPAIMFLDFGKLFNKEEKASKFDKAFVIVLVVSGFIGLLNIVLLPYGSALLLWVVITVLAIFMRFIPHQQKAPKWVKITAIALLSLIVIYLILFMVAGLTGKLDNKLFNNALVRDNLPVFKALFENDHGFVAVLFGANLNDTYGKVGNVSVSTIRTSSFEFEALLEGGIICFLALLATIVFSVISIRKYLHKEEKIPAERMAIALLIFSWFVYKSFLSDTVPFINSNLYVPPFSQDATILLVLLLLGYTQENVFEIKMEEKVHEDR